MQADLKLICRYHMQTMQLVCSQAARSAIMGTSSMQLLQTILKPFPDLFFFQKSQPWRTSSPR